MRLSEAKAALDDALAGLRTTSIERRRRSHAASAPSTRQEGRGDLAPVTPAPPLPRPRQPMPTRPRLPEPVTAGERIAEPHPTAPAFEPSYRRWAWWVGGLLLLAGATLLVWALYFDGEVETTQQDRPTVTGPRTDAPAEGKDANPEGK